MLLKSRTTVRPSDPKEHSGHFNVLESLSCNFAAKLFFEVCEQQQVKEFLPSSLHRHNFLLSFDLVVNLSSGFRTGQ